MANPRNLSDLAPLVSVLNNTVSFGGNLSVTGDLLVTGTSYTINSTTVTVDDPVLTLGGDTAPTTDDNKDRGVEFRWHNGTGAKVGFFGYDDSTGKFTFVPDATNTSEVFSGTKGTLDANLEWTDVLNKPSPQVGVSLTGDVTGSGTATLTSLGNGTINISTTIAANSVSLGTDTVGDYAASVSVSGVGLSLTGAAGEGTAYTVTSNATSANTANAIVARDGSGNFSAGTITAALSGNASTATNVAWSGITSKPTTISGFGITDAPVLSDTLNLTSEKTGSVSTAGWYTIATQSTARGYGEFYIYDVDSARHNFVRFTVVFSFGSGGITVLSSGRHGTSTIRHIRVLYNTSDPTYGGGKIQVYCENPSWTIISRMANSRFSNWDTFAHITPVLENTPSGWAEYTRVEAVNDNGVIGGSRLRLGSTDALLAGNQVLHAGNYTSYAMPIGSSATNSVDIRAPIFYDSNNTGYYFDGASTSVLNYLQVGNHIEQGNNLGRPNVNWSASGTSTGMVIFYLPGVSSTNYGMVHMVFDIYEYVTNRTATVIIGGHNWSTSWYNVGCNVVGFTNKSVRLGVKDGRYCVVFGTSGSSWEYGTIVLRKIHNAGFYDNIMDMNGNWSATQTTTESFSSVTADLRELRTSNNLIIGGGIETPTMWVNYSTANNNNYNENIRLFNASNGVSVIAFSASGASGIPTTSILGYSDRLETRFQSQWQERIYNGYAEAYGSYRAPIFYDSNSTGYYVDPNSDSILYKFQNINQRVAYDRGWGNYPSITVFNTTDQGPQGDFRIHGAPGSNGGDFSVRLLVDGTIESSADVRGPIFYDSNNTGYYLDPASTSVLNRISTVRTDNWLYIDQNYGHSVVGAYASTRYQGVFAMGDSYKLPADGTTTGNLYGIAWSHPNAGGAAANLASHGMLILENGVFKGAWGGGRLTTPGDVRGTIFYDYDNTGYYCDPSSSSYLYSLQLSGNAYFRPNNWIQMDSSYGIYWPNHYGAHLYPNTGSTYTQLRIDGSKSSYGGIWDSYSAVNIGMYDSSGNGGVYREANGRWFFYYHVGNDCMGIGTSGTSSTYSIYANKGAYFPNRVDGTIFYDANDTSYYVDPATTSLTNDFRANIFYDRADTSYYAQPRSVSYFNDFRPNIIYDRQDTGYYCDPNGTNRLNVVNSNNHYIQPGYMLYSDHGSWQGEYNKIQWHANHLYLQNNGGGYLLILRRGDGGERFYCDYSGNVTASGNITAYSDIRLKQNIQTIKNPVGLVKALRGVTFDWKETGKHSYGLIAQEVEQVIPELVMETDSGTTETDIKQSVKSVDYSKLVSVLIEAVKEQQDKIDRLESQVNKLLGV